ncbi:MAG TPA: efflux RND transporter periplasmic adaptor subunit [Opitutaceae bacterium]
MNLRPLLTLLLGFGSAAAAAAVTPGFDGLVLPFKEVVVAAPVQSTIEHIAFKEGDRVKAGETLAQLYSRIEELDMLRAKSALEKREFDFKGSKNLFDAKVISEDEALKNKIELDLARLQYEQATEVFRQRTIVAPIDGLIVEKLREVGESVTATQPMFRLVDISQVYVQFYLRVEDLPRVQIGASVQVACRLGGEKTRTFTGMVDFIDPRVDAASGLLRVKVLVDNANNVIKPGLRADVTLP